MNGRTRLSAEIKYQLLFDISQKTRDTLDLEAILNHLLDVVEATVRCDAAGIFVLNEESIYPGPRRPREIIAGVVLRGFDDRATQADPMRRLGKGVIGHSIRTGKSVVIPDVRLDPNYVEGRKGTRSEIAVPIRQSGRTIGALNLESDRPSAFNESDVEALRFFADAAAISIEKAMVHRQILETERIEEQLRIARQVQSRLLPAESPRLPGYDIEGACITTYAIGGDCFDYIPLSKDRFGLVVADVSGTGVPAALIMATFRALLRTQAKAGSRPFRVMQAINKLLPEFTPVGTFVSSVYGVLDLGEGRFTYANSGHEPPILVRADGSIERLECAGLVLSVVSDAGYADCEVVLDHGGSLVLYTDGVVEAADQAGNGFGVDRLEAAIKRSSKMTASAMIDKIIRATKAFSGSESYGDDVTIMIVKRQ